METQDNNVSLAASRFCKLVLQETGKLVIPEGFARKYLEVFQEEQMVYLRVPPGTVWGMRLKKEGKDLILHGGSWLRFAKFYGIKFGHLLVFSYKGNSTIDLVIFDDTATEITYPFKCNGSRENVAPKIEEQDDSVDVEDDDNDEDEDEDEDDEDDDEDDEDYEDPDEDDDDDVSDIRSRKSSSFAKSVAGASSNASRSENPHFRVIVAATYLTTTYGLHVPTKFANEYLKDGDSLAILYNDRGRFWEVHFSFRKFTDQVKAKITIGWKIFAQENDLTIGDVCSFYLVKRSVPLRFRFSVWRQGCGNLSTPAEEGQSVDQSKSTQCFVPASKRKANLDSEECSSRQIFEQVHFNFRNSKKPVFSLTMTEHYLRRWNVPIKTSFLKHLKKKEQMATLVVGKGKWKVKAICYPNRKGILSNGWYKFEADNKLQVGDTCVFKLIQKQDMVFKVSIHRASAVGGRE